MKRLMIVLFSAFIGIIGSPEMLMASDESYITGLNDRITTETAVIEEKHPEALELETLEKLESPISITEISSTFQPYAPANRIVVGGRTIEMINSNDTKNDAGRYVARYNDHFLYGHNSNTVFDVLYYVNRGDVFEIVNNGVSTFYQIRDIVIYRKTGDTTLQVDDASSGIDGQDVPMKYVANGQENSSGRQYSVALMTCYGRSYGNGDASHRLVVFADAI